MKLALATLPPEPPGPPRGVFLFLHGILGSGTNWRGFAKRLLAGRPGLEAWLVDLRMHGRSQGFPPPHTVEACARDLVALAASEGKTVTHVLGHSFGGKVAMAFALARPEPLERVFVIDSHPGIPKVQRGSETTMRVLELLRAAPARFPTRDAFTAFFVERGLDRGVTAWLAMNLAAEGDDFVFRLDLDAIEALLHDYLVTDGFSLVEAPPAGFSGRVVVVKGGSSPTVDAEAEARLRAAAEARPAHVAFETIPNAGHWVHVDAPDALLAVVGRHLET